MAFIAVTATVITVVEPFADSHCQSIRLSRRRRLRYDGLSMTLVWLMHHVVRFSFSPGYYRLQPFEIDGGLYERLGVETFKWLLFKSRIERLNISVRLSHGRAGLQCLERGIREAETGHVIALLAKVVIRHRRMKPMEGASVLSCQRSWPRRIPSCRRTQSGATAACVGETWEHQPPIGSQVRYLVDQSLASGGLYFANKCPPHRAISCPTTTAWYGHHAALKHSGKPRHGQPSRTSTWELYNAWRRFQPDQRPRCQVSRKGRGAQGALPGRSGEIQRPAA